MNPDDLKRILDALTHADVREFNLTTGSFNLSLKRGPQASYALSETVASAPAAASAGFAPVTAPSGPSNTSAPAPMPAAESAEAVETPKTEAAPVATAAGTPVKAPIVGTFYAASSPEAAPYVKVGDTVKTGQVLCIIEAMKLMNEIEAETTGVVREILVQNAEPVEYGQTLFIIE